MHLQITRKIIILLLTLVGLMAIIFLPNMAISKVKKGIIHGVNLSDFDGVDAYFTLNGEANFAVDTLFSEGNEEKKILRLTNRKSNPDGLIAGSAFLKDKFVGNKVRDYSFSTFFRIRVTGKSIYDGSGMLFIIHADKRKDKALGRRRGGMGYAGFAIRGSKSINPSVAIKFNVQDNTQDIDINAVGTVFNGSLKSLYPPYGYPLINGRFNDGIPLNVWINYDGNYLTVHTSREDKFKNATLHTNRLMDLSHVLKLKLSGNKSQPDVYVGFSADPGFYPAYHDVLEWYFRPVYNPFKDYCNSNIDKKCKMF
ncbi:MAG: hypothetical protein ACJARD_001068 [Alphaproteobacteria bacterium]|jgi:hypothetical protein